MNIIHCSVVCIFFFFQAEDGIRDYKVTGVQTCALPIYLAKEVRAPAIQPLRCREAAGELVPAPHVCESEASRHQSWAEMWSVAAVADRSEERRVGKECRSRWSPYH